MALEDRIRLPLLNLIHRRPRLLTQLEKFIESGQRLITIYAPGGYGKSILLADFTQTTNLPVCWCSLEPADRDPTAFLTLLVHSITDRFHELERVGLLKLVEQGDTQNSVLRIAELLGSVGRHIIILDDYHKAVSAGMTLALNGLLEQLPPTCTLIVAARGDMTLETGQVLDLLITDQVGGLSEEELRFTPEEVQLMMRKRFGRRIELNQAANIAEATDGNIAQILLTGHMMDTNQNIGSLRQRLGNDQAVVYSYLAKEVFDKQPPHLQKFLLYTAILPNMTAELCNALLDSNDAQERLEELVRKDLFIAQIGAGFRYHDLFAEFLRSKLAANPAQHCQITNKAASLLAERARFEDAIYLYLSIQAWDAAATLLEKQGRGFYNTGRALTLNSWLEQIPEPELAQRPRLLLLRGQILTNDLGQLDLAMAYFEQAEKQFYQQQNLVGTAEAKIFRSGVMRMKGQAQKALTLATEAVEQLEHLDAKEQLVAYAIRSRGLAHGIAGDIPEALADLRRALRTFEELKEEYIVGMGHHEIGVCLEKLGNINGAEHHYKQALRTWEMLGNANDLTNTLNSLGVCAYLRGSYPEALRKFKDSLEIALQIGAMRRAAFAQAGLGDVYLAHQEYKLAVQAYKTSTEFSQKAGVHALELYNLVKLGECFYRQEKLNQALILATQAKEIAQETGLTFEEGLATKLQGKIYVRRAEYSAAINLFATAVTYFTENAILEQASTRLWWGYSLLLDAQATAAFTQLQEALRLTLAMGDLVQALGPTIAETRDLFLHFVHLTATPAGTRDNIGLLLAQHKADQSSPGLQLFVFGTPYLVVAGRQRQFSMRGGSRKIPEFLLYLLINGQDGGSRWDEVSLAIWPEADRDKASANFHQTLRRLRDNIFADSSYIITKDDHYLINPDYLKWCDLPAFDKLFDRMAETSSREEALALQSELINLYQGELLAGFELGEWGTTYRQAYETKFFQVVKLASDQLLKQNAAQEALNVIGQGLAQDYFQEDLHRNAFKAYAQLGLYDDLTTYYNRLCQIFMDELAAPPDKTTQQLYHQLSLNQPAIA